MAEPRRIVPDNSALLPAFFQETITYRGASFNLSQRARPLVSAILDRSVIAFAPEILIHEFTSTVVGWAWPREGPPRINPDEAARQVEAFFRLPINFVPAEALAGSAWSYMTEKKIAPADSWYLACAAYYDAELWLSHQHSDQLFERAAWLHPKRVFTLTEHPFGKLGA